MPTRTLPWTSAERAQRYRERQRGQGLVYSPGYAPSRLVDSFVEMGLLPQQDASDPRAVFAALIRAAERYVKKTERRDAKEPEDGVSR